MIAQSCTSEVTGVILVGGKSRRMGRDKAFLPWEGRPLFEKVLGVLQENFQQILLVGDQAERFAGYPVEVVPDIFPGSALGGLYTGLARARTEHIFVSPCDMPFPSAGLVRYLCSLREGFDAVVPQTEQALEPLFAVYAKSSLSAMRDLLAVGNLRIYDLYPLINTRYVAGEELLRSGGDTLSLLNLNTPQELEALVTWRR